jgi:hypothetical protein
MRGNFIKESKKKQPRGAMKSGVSPPPPQTLLDMCYSINVFSFISTYWLSHILFKNIPEFTNMIEFTFTENVINVKYKWPLCYCVSYFCVNVHNVFKL